MAYTTSPDPVDPAITILTVDGVAFRVRGADRPGALVAPSWSSQIDQLAAGLALIPGTYHADIAPAEIQVAPGAGGSSYHDAHDRITIHDARFTASFNLRTFQSLVHECGHSLDKRLRYTSRIRSRNPDGDARETRWQQSLPAPIAHWVSGTSPTFPAGTPRDEWDHFRAIDYRGRNRVHRSGLPTPGESFAEGFMMVLCRPTRAATPEQARIIRNLIGL